MKGIFKKILSKYFILSAFLLLLTIFPLHNAFALTTTPLRLEVAGDPGQVLSQEMTLINERDTTETYYSSYANFEAQGETGSPTFVPAKDDLGTWMTTVPLVVLPPKTSKIVQIKITIPRNADAGGHFAAVLWGTTPTDAAPGSVSIGAKTAILMLLRVNGPVNEKGGILEFATKNKQTFFTSLPVSFYYRFQNGGGDRIKPMGDIVMKDMIGLTATKIAGNPVEGNVLPASVRRFETVWSGSDGPTAPEEQDQGNFFNKVGYEWRNFAFGYYRAHMSLVYGTKNETAIASFAFWVFPWHLTLFSIVLLLILFFGGRASLRRYNHWVIAKAGEMLKRENDAKTHDEPNSRK